MSADMARAMRDDTGGRHLSMRVHVALFAVALAAVTLPACQHDATLDPFVGPSELALSLTLTASPDVLALDGGNNAKRSEISIFARDGLMGQPKPDLELRLQIRYLGELQDFGQLSAKSVRTGQDGRAVATYTAPLSLSGVDTQAEVEILVTPVGDNYATAVPRSVTIRLMPIGIVVPPFSLTAGFRFTPSSPVEFQEVLFEATDTSGQVVIYAWDFGDGTTGTGRTVTHAFSTASTYTVTLTVTDAFNRSASAPQSLTVGAGPTPEAEFEFSPDKPTTMTTVQFNAIASTPPPGRTITGYAWDFGDGTPTCLPLALHPVCQTGVTVSHTFSVAGTYNVTLTVTDSSGATDTRPRPVTVSGVSDPTASFTASPNPATLVGGTVTVNFNGSASSAAGSRTIASYSWDFGDGIMVVTTTATTTHAFTTTGTFKVTLTVTDSAGATGQGDPVDVVIE